MRNTIYRQLVRCIHEYRTWIKVVGDNLYKEHVVFLHGRSGHVVSRMLVLQVYKEKGTYEKGMTWTVPEYALDKALATYRKQDRSFRQRISKTAMHLTAKDAETIIRLATYGVVRLELVVRPVYLSEKPYYL